MVVRKRQTSPDPSWTLQEQYPILHEIFRQLLVTILCHVLLVWTNTASGKSTCLEL